MKGFKLYNPAWMVLMLFLGIFLVAPVQAQYKVKKFDMKECESKYNECTATQNIVDSVIKDVESRKMNTLVFEEIKDAKMWEKKALAFMEKVKKDMDEKKVCTYQMTEDLDQALQWMIKAGVAAVRGQIAQKQNLGDKETWRK